MPMKLCSKEKHFYDTKLYATCPVCQEDDGPQDRFNTVEQKVADTKRTEPMKTLTKRVDGHDDPPVYNKKPEPVKSPRTIVLGPLGPIAGQSEDDFMPVLGWLVIVDGPGRGRDYRLAHARTRIGRSKEMEVCLELPNNSDMSISREEHAVIIYNGKLNKFFLSDPGKSSNLVIHNGNMVYGLPPQELNANDIIQLGETKLLFFPLCNENFHW